MWEGKILVPIGFCDSHTGKRVNSKEEGILNDNRNLLIIINTVDTTGKVYTFFKYIGANGFWL